MSFSSAEWTIPELCVWIVTGNRSAINNLSPTAQRSLKVVNILWPGAYASRDEIISRAQEGALIVTCANPRRHHHLDPERISLSPQFWRSAELNDVSSWMAAPSAGTCAARRLGKANPVDYFDLLVSSARARELWADRGEQRSTPMHEVVATLPPAANAISTARLEREFGTFAAEKRSVGKIVKVREAWAAMKLKVGDSVPRSAVELLIRKLPEEERAPKNRPPTKIA